MTAFHVQQIISYHLSDSQLYVRAKVQPRISNPKDAPPGVGYVRYDLPRIEHFLWEDFELLPGACDAFLTGFKSMAKRMAAEQMFFERNDAERKHRTFFGLLSCFRLQLVSFQPFHSVVLISIQVNNYWAHHTPPRSRYPSQDRSYPSFHSFYFPCRLYVILYYFLNLSLPRNFLSSK